MQFIRDIDPKEIKALERELKAGMTLLGALVAVLLSGYICLSVF